MQSIPCRTCLAHYLPCLTVLSRRQHSPCLAWIRLYSLAIRQHSHHARSIGTALVLPCPAWLSPCRSFLSSFFFRTMTATQNTPPSRQPHLFRSQTGHTVSLLLYVTTYKFHCYYTLLYVTIRYYLYVCLFLCVSVCFYVLLYNASKM